MKKLCILSAMVLLMAFALIGCSSSGGGDDGTLTGQQNLQEEQNTPSDAADNTEPVTDNGSEPQDGGDNTEPVTDGGNEPQDGGDNTEPEPVKLSSLKGFASDNELAEYLKTGLRSNAAPMAYRDDLAEAVPAADDSGSGSNQFFSKTNIQEAGVDEADTIKTDGQYLYIAPAMQSFWLLEDDAVMVKSGTARDTASGSAEGREPVLISEEETADSEPLIAPAPVSDSDSEDVVIAPEPDISPYPNEKFENVIKVLELSSNPADSKEITTIPLDDFENHVGGLYLFTERGEQKPDLLVTIGETSHNIWGDWFCPWCWRNGTTEIALFNVENPAKPEKISHIKLDGQLISSRRIEDQLYLVTRYTPNLPDFNPYPIDDKDKKNNEEVLEKTNLSDLLPRVNVDGADKGALVTTDDCYQPPLNEDRVIEPNLITVTAIDLNNPNNRISRTITGPSETMYMSTTSLYLATTRYQYRPLIGLAEAEAADTAALPPETTDLHKFSLTKSGPVYKGSGSVPGHLGWNEDKKPFRMSEYKDILRIATSLGNSWDETSRTRLTLFEQDSDGSLEETGHIDNIGEKGESLYAVRFIGNRGYLVTFRVTDPLYVFDLSDPYNPVQTGELHINGYSDYLHPISENLLLGIGKDAVPDNFSDDFGGRGAWYQGVKLSLFDVSNPAEPYEKEYMIIGKRGTDAGVLYDHHALAYLPPMNGNPAKLALPIRLHTTPPVWKEEMDGFNPAEPSAWYDWTHTGLYLFEISESSIKNTGKMIVSDQSQNDYYYDDITSDRAVLIDDSVHYIHNTKVWSALWGDIQ